MGNCPISIAEHSGQVKVLLIFLLARSLLFLVSILFDRYTLFVRLLSLSNNVKYLSKHCIDYTMKKYDIALLVNKDNESRIL